MRSWHDLAHVTFLAYTLDWYTQNMRYFIYCRKSTESEDRQILSIDSQRAELERSFGARDDIEFTAVFQEAYSAKAPGRPVFNRMLQGIEDGEADGIIAWHPDRLARNSIDGGRIIYLLDRKVLKDLKFANFTFENNSQGKLMLSVLLGFSKYYVDSLSENVKRGNRAKVERGWRPNHAPLGYRNDPITKTILKDPERFPMVRRMFDLELTDSYSLRRLSVETQQWGLQTPKRKRMGGKYLSVSKVYHILTNPFYAGVLKWAGETYPGAHEPMVTWNEFERVQRYLKRKGKSSPKKHFFPFTGLMRCGECGLMVTAENKINRYGYHYTYYHCTKKRLDHNCSQPSISAANLGDAFTRFLREHTVPQKLHTWALKEIHAAQAAGGLGFEAQERGLRRSLNDTNRALENLTSLRIRDSISEAEFASQRKLLLNERLNLEQSVTSLKKSGNWLEPTETLFWFSSRALDWYSDADDQTKRRIIQSVGSNLTLKDKIVSIQAKKPLTLIRTISDSPTLLAALNGIRNLFEMQDKELLDMVAEIKPLIAECERRENEFKKAA